MFFDEIRGEAVMPRRDWGVRSKDDPVGKASPCLLKVDLFGAHTLTNDLQNRKGTMAFVQMQDSRMNA